MRKLIVSNIMTIDGYFTGPGGNPLVLNMDAAFDAQNLERMRTAGTILLGRASFELFSSFWPQVADAPEDPQNPALSATNREFSRRYRDIPKIVVSDSYQVAADNAWHDTTTVVSGTNLDAVIRSEKDADGADIVVFASRALWNGLLERDLVDELHLVIGPHAIGGGTPLFTGPASLRLLSSTPLAGSDNILVTYAPAGR